jgi:hypothetical protein
VVVGAELRHRVVARAVTDGDRERERERRGPSAVQIEGEREIGEERIGAGKKARWRKR